MKKAFWEGNPVDEVVKLDIYLGKFKAINRKYIYAKKTKKNKEG